jgi:hypothetical protein
LEDGVDAPFLQAVDQWHDFYLMAGTAGATLIGLLFVSVSLYLESGSRQTAPRRACE